MEMESVSNPLGTLDIEGGNMRATNHGDSGDSASTPPPACGDQSILGKPYSGCFRIAASVLAVTQLINAFVLLIVSLFYNYQYFKGRDKETWILHEMLNIAFQPQTYLQCAMTFSLALALNERRSINLFCFSTSRREWEPWGSPWKFDYKDCGVFGLSVFVAVFGFMYAFRGIDGIDEPCDTYHVCNGLYYIYKILVIINAGQLLISTCFFMLTIRRIVHIRQERLQKLLTSVTQQTCASDVRECLEKAVTWLLQFQAHFCWSLRFGCSSLMIFLVLAGLSAFKEARTLGDVFLFIWFLALFFILIWYLASTNDWFETKVLLALDDNRHLKMHEINAIREFFLRPNAGSAPRVPYLEVFGIPVTPKLVMGYLVSAFVASLAAVRYESLKDAVNSGVF